MCLDVDFFFSAKQRTVFWFMISLLILDACSCDLPSYLLFFFKQKTAYEMRISDWSSDVCSSDLPPDRLVLDQLALVQRLQHMPGNRLALAVGVGGEDQGVGVLEGPGDVGDGFRSAPGHLVMHLEILVRLDRTVLGRQEIGRAHV